MSVVNFYKIPREQLASLPIKEGQIIFVTDTQKLYLDESNNSRIQIDGKDFTYGLSIDGNTLSIEKDDGNTSVSLPSYTAADVGAIALTAKGANGGVAELDNSGKVPSAQLPSYVDDVLEYASLNEFPATGESGKIYIDLSTDKTYRWGGSTYVIIASDLALGETSTTAYRGDRGKIAYDHSQSTHAPIDAQENVIETIKVNGESLKPDQEKAVNITIPAAAESVHLVNTNSSSVPFILSDIDPGIYIFPDQQIYLKAKTTNTTSYSFKSIDRSIIVTGMVTKSLRSNSILCVGTNTNGIGICLAYDNTSGDVGSGLTAIACTSSIVNTGNSQTISGKKTFSTLPESSVIPTTDNQLVNKKYVDDNTGGDSWAVYTVTTNNSYTPFILLDKEPGLYIFPSQKIYIKAKDANTTAYELTVLNKTLTVTGVKSEEAIPSTSILATCTDKTGAGWTLYYEDDIAHSGIGNGVTNTYISTTNTAQTISGKKTFSTLPESSIVPTTDDQLTNKKYVDDSAYVLPAATQSTLGGVKMYVDANNILQISTN